MRVYTLYVSTPDFHLPSLWITRSEISPPVASTVAAPMCNECNDTRLGSTPALSAIWWMALVACLYIVSYFNRIPDLKRSQGRVFRHGNIDRH